MRSPIRRTVDRSRLGAATGLVSVLLFVLIAVLIRANWTPLTHLDRRVANNLHQVALGHSTLLRVWRDVSDVFAPAVWRVAAVVAALILVFWGRVLRAALIVAVAVLGTIVLSSLSKVIVDRDRPHFAHPVAHAAGQSYPSGHALTSLVAVAAAAIVCSRRARPVVLGVGAVIVAAVGFSRLILGVHYLSDVVGGWLLGTAWICLVAVVFSSSRVPASPAGRWPRSRRLPR